MSIFKPLQFVANRIANQSDTDYLEARPYPRAYDDRYDYETSQNRDLQVRGRHSNFTNMIRSIQTIRSKGPPELNLHVAEGIIDKALHPNAVDDRKGAVSAY
jgi:hypothetical protein